MESATRWRPVGACVDSDFEKRRQQPKDTQSEGPRHPTGCCIRRATIHDKIGNNLSDEQADEGVNSIDGQGLTRLAKWIQDRHDNYINFMKRIHKVMVAVHTEEKRRRKHNDEVGKGLLGYDPKIDTKTDVRIRCQAHLNIQYRKLDLPPPIIGKHRHRHVQSTYDDIHRFLNQVEWPLLKRWMATARCLGPHGLNYSSCSPQATSGGAKAYTPQARQPKSERTKGQLKEIAK